MENFIVIIALVAAAAGSLILLSCMAGKRAELIKVYLTQKQLEARERVVEQKVRQKQTGTDILEVSEELPDQPKGAGIASAQPAR